MKTCHPWLYSWHLQENMHPADMQLPRDRIVSSKASLTLHCNSQACLLSAQKQLSVNVWLAAGHSMVCCSASVQMPVC